MAKIFPTWGGLGFAAIPLTFPRTIPNSGKERMGGAAKKWKGKQDLWGKSYGETGAKEWWRGRGRPKTEKPFYGGGRGLTKERKGESAVKPYSSQKEGTDPRRKRGGKSPLSISTPGDMPEATRPRTWGLRAIRG